MNITRIIQATAAVAIMTLGSIFASSLANAGCYEWDNAYEHQCWGPWIDSPDLYKEANGDPFTIGGGDDSQWHFSLDGTRTPNADVPTSGKATYTGHMWGRAAGGSGNNSSRSGMLFPVTGDVRANINFGSSVNTRIDLNFTDIQVHRKTTGENPVDLPNVHMNFDNNSSYGDVTRNGFSFDTEGEAIEKPYSKEFYNWRLRRMYRDAAVTGHFYGPDAEGVAGKFYFVEGQWMRRKGEVTANIDGFGGCSSDCATVYWKVEGTWGATK